MVADRIAIAGFERHVPQLIEPDGCPRPEIGQVVDDIVVENVPKVAQPAGVDEMTVARDEFANGEAVSDVEHCSPFDSALRPSRVLPRGMSPVGPATLMASAWRVSSRSSAGSRCETSRR